MLKQKEGEWVGGEPRKTAGPTLRGAARSRTLQEGPNVCCGLVGHPSPITGPGAKGWDAAAIPPRVVPDRCKGIHCLAFVFSALVCFSRVLC